MQIVKVKENNRILFYLHSIVILKSHYEKLLYYCIISEIDLKFVKFIKLLHIYKVAVLFGNRFLQNNFASVVYP